MWIHDTCPNGEPLPDAAVQALPTAHGLQDIDPVRGDVRDELAGATLWVDESAAKTLIDAIVAFCGCRTPSRAALCETARSSRHIIVSLGHCWWSLCGSNTWLRIDGHDLTRRGFWIVSVAFVPVSPPCALPALNCRFFVFVARIPLGFWRSDLKTRCSGNAARSLFSGPNWAAGRAGCISAAIRAPRTA